MKSGPHLQRRLVLRDGTKIVLRAILPTDKAALDAAFHRASPKTRYERFLAHVSTLTPAMLRYLTEIDGTDHVALVAFADHLDDLRGEPRMVGVARFIRLPAEPNVAEMAIMIVDDFQGRGLGSRLYDALFDVARDHEIDTFVAHTLASNVMIRRLLRRRAHLTTAGTELRATFIPEPAHGFAGVVTKMRDALRTLQTKAARATKATRTPLVPILKRGRWRS